MPDCTECFVGVYFVCMGVSRLKWKICDKSCNVALVPLQGLACKALSCIAAVVTSKQYETATSSLQEPHAAPTIASTKSEPTPDTTAAKIIQMSEDLPNDKQVVTYPSFAGRWKMDLKASDSLEQVLGALGFNSFVAMIVDRLGVIQDIEQSYEWLHITVHYELLSLRIMGSATISLPFDGTVTEVPGPTGGTNAQTSRWTAIRSEKGDNGKIAALQTRQAVTGMLGSTEAVIFQTLRYKMDNGSSLCEDCRVLKGKREIARARRLLRRA